MKTEKKNKKNRYILNKYVSEYYGLELQAVIEIISDMFGDEGFNELVHRARVYSREIPVARRRVKLTRRDKMILKNNFKNI